MHVLSYLSALVLTAVFAVNFCYNKEGDCDVMATYYPSENKTYWTSACEDGGVFLGAIGGNTIPGICGV
ncbi:MAG: hypothetical protein R2834_18070 [Rhodothermales bacterium]